MQFKHIIYSAIFTTACVCAQPLNAQENISAEIPIDLIELLGEVDDGNDMLAIAQSELNAKPNGSLANETQTRQPSKFSKKQNSPTGGDQ
jgi:hypothetical protein